MKWLQVKFIIDIDIIHTFYVKSIIISNVYSQDQSIHLGPTNFPVIEGMKNKFIYVLKNCIIQFVSDM